jgi:cell division transport system permease protein
MKRALKNSAVNFWRNKITTLATMLVIAILLFILNTILAVHFTAQEELTRIGKKIDLTFYIQDTTDPKNIYKIEQYFKTLDGVEKVEFTSKQKALEQFLDAHPKTAEYYKKFKLENTLPASFRVSAANPEFYGKIQDAIRASEFKDDLANISEDVADLTVNGTIVKNLENMTSFTSYLLYWVMIAFGIGALLMIYNVVYLHIFTRKSEINIMRLVGGKSSFIQLPYLIEALWISLMALATSFLIFVLVNHVSLFEKLKFFGRINHFPYLKVLTVEAGVTILLTLVSSFIAVQKHIKTNDKN